MMSGYTADELRGMNIQDIVFETEEAYIQKVRELEGGFAQFQARHRRKDGTTFDVEVRTRFYEGKDGKVVLGVGTDITQGLLVDMLNSSRAT
jgi:PAS domain S-box-containing protein